MACCVLTAGAIGLILALHARLSRKGRNGGKLDPRAWRLPTEN